MVQTKKKKALLIYDFEELKLKHTEAGLHASFSSLFMISPLYNEYFKKQLIIFEKSFKKVSNSFQMFHQIDKVDMESEEGIGEIEKKHSMVGLTSTGSRPTAKSRVSTNRPGSRKSSLKSSWTTKSCRSKTAFSRTSSSCGWRLARPGKGTWGTRCCT